MWRYKLDTKSIILGAIQLLQLVATVIFMISLINLNMLPTILLVAVGVGAVIFFGLTTFLQTRDGIKRYVGTALCLLISIFMIVASMSISKADSTLSEISKPEEYVDKVVFVTRVDSDIESITDIGETIVGAQYTQQSDLMLATEGKLLLENNIEFNIKTYGTIIEQVLALLNEEVDVIIYNSAYGDLFLEQMPDFNKQTKIVHTCDMTVADVQKYKDVIDLSLRGDYVPPEPEITEPEEIPEISEPEYIPPENEDIFAVYMSGIDVYGSITTNSRSDVNIIGIVNPKENKILLVTTPRDTFVRIPGVSGNKKDKLTHAGIYGIDASMNTLSELYNVKLDYYVRVNFTSFEKVVDALGGISVYSAYNFNAAGYSYQKGYNDLNGKEALAFVRERYSFAAGDNQRGKNQQEAIKAIIKKACSPAILTAANDILDSVRDNIDMNVPEELIQNMIKKQLADGKEWEIVTMALTGTGSSDEPYSMPGFNAYVMIPNESSIEEIRQAIAAMYE